MDVTVMTPKPKKRKPTWKQLFNENYPLKEIEAEGGYGNRKKFKG